MKKLLLLAAVLCIGMTAQAGSCNTCNTGCSEKLCDVVTEKKVVYDKCPYEVCKLNCETKYKEVPRTLTRQVCTGRAGSWKGHLPCKEGKCGRCETCHKRGHVIHDDAVIEENNEAPEATETRKEVSKQTRADRRANRKAARNA